MYYSVNKIRKSYMNMIKKPGDLKFVTDFYTPQNIFNKLGVNEFFIPENGTDIYINHDALEKINLLAFMKIKRQMPIKRVGAENEFLLPNMIRYECKSFNDVTIAVGKQLKDGADRDRWYNNIKLEYKEKKLLEIPNDFLDKKSVSIDIEFSNKKELITEIGVTVRDNGIINSYHYLIKELYEKENDKKQKRFKYGKTNIIEIAAIKETLETHIADAAYLVFHDGVQDLYLLNKYGFKSNQFETFKIFDAQVIQGRNIGLQDMLKHYQIEHTTSQLHNSGNDARYTLELCDKIALEGVKPVIKNRLKI